MVQEAAEDGAMVIYPSRKVDQKSLCYCEEIWLSKTTLSSVIDTENHDSCIDTH